MSFLLFGIGFGVSFYATGVLYTILAHWKPTPWWGRHMRGPKTWSWRRRLITKRWPADGWPRWSL